MNKEKVRKNLKKYGLEVIGNYEDLKNVIVKDEKGYVYKIVYSNVINTHQKVSPFHTGNPYTVYNIQKYLDNFCPSSIIISKKYLDNTSYLTFKCGLCGEIYKRPWYKMKECKRKVCNKCQRNISHKSQTKTFQEVTKIFAEYGYKILDNKYIKNSTPIHCEDKDGYKYKISLQNLQKGRTPRMFSWANNFEDCWFNLNNYININHLKNKVININSNRKATFLCECGNEFITDVYRFVQGEKTRCSICTKKVSGLELKVMNFLEENNIKYEYQYCYADCKNKKIMPFDFYLNDYNVCVEVDGDQHFHCAFTNDKERALKEFEKLKRNDKKKEQYCLDNNIRLIRIPFWEIKNNKFKKICLLL